MKIDTRIDTFIDKLMLEEEVKKRAEHEGSKGLTASSLFQPKRFQLLKALGIPQKEADTYSLRKFARGRAVEDWYVEKCKLIPGLVVETQKEVKYRNVIGLVDAVMDNDQLDFKVGIIPHEVKSVTNRNFKWIHDKGEVSEHYKLQAGLYALALGKGQYAIDFIASDDLRVYSILFDVSEVKPRIDQIINEFEQMMELKTVPEWKVSMKWQEDPKYMPYDPFWATCTETEFRNQLKTLGIEYGKV